MKRNRNGITLFKRFTAMQIAVIFLIASCCLAAVAIICLIFEKDTAGFWATLGIAGLLMGASVVTLSVIAKEKIFVTEEKCIERHGEQTVKEQSLSQIGRLVVISVLWRGFYRKQKIVFDDGAFSGKAYGETYAMFFARMEQEERIVLDYSARRLKRIQEYLPACEVTEVKCSYEG